MSTVFPKGPLTSASSCWFGDAIRALRQHMRNPVKALLVPITESQMAELQALSEHGRLEAIVSILMESVQSVQRFILW